MISILEKKLQQSLNHKVWHRIFSRYDTWNFFLFRQVELDRNWNYVIFCFLSGWARETSSRTKSSTALFKWSAQQQRVSTKRFCKTIAEFAGLSTGYLNFDWNKLRYRFKWSTCWCMIMLKCSCWNVFNILTKMKLEEMKECQNELGWEHEDDVDCCRKCDMHFVETQDKVIFHFPCPFFVIFSPFPSKINSC